MGVTKPSKVKMRRALITVRDGDEKIEVGIRLGYGSLTSGEADRVVAKAIRGITQVLEGLPFTDFGVENAKIDF